MNVSDVMTREVITVAASMSIDQAAHLMLEYRISGLPVVDEGGSVVGIITEADLLRRSETGTVSAVAGWRTLFSNPERLAEQYVRTHGRTVANVMTRELVAVTPATPLAEAVALMESRRIKRLPVQDAGQLVGILSRADLLRALEQLLPKTAAAAVSDAAIRRAVLAQLRQQSWLPVALVDIRVENATVELRGIILSDAQREALRILAENTPGVRAVVDRLVWVEPYTGFTVELPPAQDGSQIPSEQAGSQLSSERLQPGTTSPRVAPGVEAQQELQVPRHESSEAKL